MHPIYSDIWRLAADSSRKRHPLMELIFSTSPPGHDSLWTHHVRPDINLVGDPSAALGTFRLRDGHSTAELITY